ncbi:MAG TPA: hypothetical protein VLN58_03455 [Verrucomicrobiae bacterium]|nr:hypothetical protein [Verrucomicrobiae bacterium]
MDYEEQWKEWEAEQRMKACERCDDLKAQIERLSLKVREVSDVLNPEEYHKRKRQLNWFIEEQLRHQAEHDNEDPPED